MTLFDPESPAELSAGPGSEKAGPTAPEEEDPPGETVRIRMVVAYDGAGFHGFAAQPGQETVAGALSGALARVARHRVDLTCAGRTDAGVHARGQVVHADVRAGVDLRRLQKSLNSMLGPSIVVRSAEIAPEGFDARHSARARRYRYLVLESAVPDPLLAPSAWTVAGPLDLRAMVSAADALLGEHDFRAFCRRVPGTSPADEIPRRVVDAGWRVVPVATGELGPASRLLRFEIEAQSFCHQMVRSIVGMLVDVGKGRRRASDVHWLLASGDRSQAGDLAPPQGLCLLEVLY